jgi:hypothetical protein
MVSGHTGSARNFRPRSLPQRIEFWSIRIGVSVTADLQRQRLNRFPYSLLYHHADDEIFVLAVMHHSRNPDYWKDRL